MARMALRAFPLAALIALLPAAARPQPGAAPASAPPAPGAALEEVLGTVLEVDRREHLVYVPGGLGTVLDVVPGAYVRAGRNGAFVAYWVQVRPAPRL